MRSNNTLLLYYIEIYGSIFKLFQKPRITNRVNLLFQTSSKAYFFRATQFIWGINCTLNVTPVSAGIRVRTTV